MKALFLFLFACTSCFAGDFIVKHSQYVACYNSELNATKWVKWTETKNDYGEAERCNCFTHDPLLPDTFTRISTKDYTKSGYERGHLLASEARTRTDTDNRATFYLTNVVPMTKSLNIGAYKQFEHFRDSLVTEAGYSLTCLAGCVYRSGTKINNKIAVPDSIFIVCIAQKDNEVTTYAYMFPNRKYTKADNSFRLYETTVENLESSSGMQIKAMLYQND